MDILRRRNKMISIRLSEEEFITFRRACQTTGARSISDLARDAMHRLLAGAPLGSQKEEGGLSTRVEVLDHKLKHLQAQVSRLAMLVGEDGK